MNKIRCMCAGLLAGAFLLSTPVGAANPQTQELVQTQTFETIDTDFHAQFDSQFESRITRGGKQYELSHIEYQVVKEEKQELDAEITYEMDFHNLYSKEEAHPQAVSYTHLNPGTGQGRTGENIRMERRQRK